MSAHTPGQMIAAAVFRSVGMEGRSWANVPADKIAEEANVALSALKETNAALLAALKELVFTSTSGTPGFNSAYRKAAAAIDKAEGSR